MTACATHQTARLEAATTLAHASQLSGTNAASAVGKSSAAWGDRWTAANLFERAVDTRSSVGNRFNLAATYEATGRLADAAALYRDLAVDGQYTYAISARSANDRDAPVRRFNVADESARRLANIERARLAIAANPTAGVLAATELGVPVSATVGGGPAAGRISDAQAQALDLAANP